MTPEQAAKRYYWIKYNSAENTVEMYLDNYMLSTLRQCEAKFYIDHILQLGIRYEKGRRKPWFFDFGEFIHYCLEIFYDSFKKTQNPPLVDKWLEQCKKKWDEMKMDEYGIEANVYPSDFKKYDDIGGWDGVAGLLIQYFAFYMDMRVRVIDTEITFGHNKEVKIGEFAHILEHDRIEWVGYVDRRVYDYEDYVRNIKVECYLTGRIDLLVDNGYKIGPVDHKTTHKFDGKEHLDFNPHDGMTGYVLAINEILDRYRNQGLTNIPRSSGGWIYHISCSRPSTPRDKTKKPEPRFKTTPIDKTIIQLEDYKARQLSSFKHIAQLIFNDEVPQWNTSACNNMYMRPCEHKILHEQPSNEWPDIIRNHYVQHIWDTREHSENKEKKITTT